MTDPSQPVIIKAKPIGQKLDAFRESDRLLFQELNISSPITVLSRLVVKVRMSLTILSGLRSMILLQSRHSRLSPNHQRLRLLALHIPSPFSGLYRLIVIKINS